MSGVEEYKYTFMVTGASINYIYYDPPYIGRGWLNRGDREAIWI